MIAAAVAILCSWWHGARRIHEGRPNSLRRPQP